MNKKETDANFTKLFLIVICFVFMGLFLVLPLMVVLGTAFRDGIHAYKNAVTDYYTRKAFQLTLKVTIFAVMCNTIFGLAAAWMTTKFHYKGKRVLTTLIDLPVTMSPVIAGLIFLLTFGRQSPLYPYLKEMNLNIVFAVPGVLLATIFVTLPFISREIIPVMEAQGSGEEEAAALLGADGFTIFWKVTFPHIKWALLYGIILCAARAMGEFGAVSVLSGHLRGKTNTLPLHIEILFNEFAYVPAFAVSSILVFLAVILLIVKSYVEVKGGK